MLKYDRGERRFQRERLKVKRKGHYGGIKVFEQDRQSKVLSIWARTATVCSCDMCGNPRRVGWESRERFGRASNMQERKAVLFFCIKEE